MLPIIASLFTITIYIFIATLFHNSGFVGAFGSALGKYNIKIFGYVGYIDFIFLLMPLIEIYKSRNFKKHTDIYVGWGLIFLSFLILQSLIFDAGSFSQILYKSLAPLIGNAGLIFLFLLNFGLGLMILNPTKLMDLFDKRVYINILNNFKESVTKSIKKASNLFKSLFNLNKKEVNDLQDIVIKPKKTTKSQTIPKNTSKTTQKTKSTNTINTQGKQITENRKEEENIKEQAQKEQIDENKNSTIVDKLEENAKILETIELGKVEKPKDFKLPPIDFLQEAPKRVKKINEAEIDRKIRDLLQKLKLFKIDGDVVRTYTGPLVTTFEFKPAPQVKVSKILSLQDDLAMALSAKTIRIQAPIPGRDVVGIEVPNDEFQTIYLRDILEDKLFKNSKSPLTVALGKDIVGNPFVTDLKKLPHLLIAGTTGSGKSVGINGMILSLLYRNDPDKLKLILIDPKMLEFSIYNDIPHLLTPVIIEPKKAIAALANLVKEMERRYKLMASHKVKNIDNYNLKAKKEHLEEMPFIVVIIDELADLMMTAGKEVEYSIARLAQMARAAGIHIIVATQRPSVDVVTGLIKANLPARLSYRVGQKIDSKVILDTMGAESLLGRGDALFTPPGATGLVRIHAPWSTEEEIENIVEFIKAQKEPNYDESYLINSGDGTTGENIGNLDLDPLFEEAKKIVLTDRKTSISYLQRKLQIGYNRSANIIEQLEQAGVLSPPNNKGAREILI